MTQYSFPAETVAYSLVRFSTKKQADGNSFQRQVTAAEHFCATQNLTLDRSLHESDIRKLGMSGLSGRHVIKGPMRRFFAGIDNGTVKPGALLVVSEWNRLTRQVASDALKLVIGMLEKNIGIVDLQDGAYYTLARYNEDVGLQVGLSIKISTAHAYSANLRHNLKSACKARREAVRAGTAKATNQCPEWLRAVEGKFEIIPDRVAIIKQIIAMRHDGLGKQAIATRLGDTPAFRGAKGWAASSVQRLVKNQALLGIYQPRLLDGTPEGDAVEGFYPRVISDADFWRAQWPETKDKVPSNGGRRNNRNLFGAVQRRCVCGAPLHFVNKGKDAGGFRFYCSASRYGRCTHRNNVATRYPELEAEMLTMLGKLDFSRLLDTRRDPATDRIAGLEAEIADKTATVDRLLSDFTAKVPAAVTKRIAQLSDDIETLEAELAALRRDAKIIEAEASRDAFAEFQTLLGTLASDPENDAIRDRLVNELGRIGEELIADRNVVRFRLRGNGTQSLLLHFVDSKFVRVLIENAASTLNIGMDSNVVSRLNAGHLAGYVAA